MSFGKNIPASGSSGGGGTSDYTDLTNKPQINGNELAAGNNTLAALGLVGLTGAQTIAGVKTFSSSPIVPTPTTDTQAANKAYADGIVAAVESHISTVETHVDEIDTEIDTKAGVLIYNNIIVASATWEADTTYTGYGFRAEILIDSNILSSNIAIVVFNPDDISTYQLANIATTYNGGIYIYANTEPTADITIPHILIIKGTVMN